MMHWRQSLKLSKEFLFSLVYIPRFGLFLAGLLEVSVKLNRTNNEMQQMCLGPIRRDWNTDLSENTLTFFMSNDSVKTMWRAALCFCSGINHWPISKWHLCQHWERLKEHTTQVRSQYHSALSKTALMTFPLHVLFLCLQSSAYTAEDSLGAKTINYVCH